MALNLPTFYKRTGSAIVFAAVMFIGLLWNDIAFLAMACLINMLCLRDFFRLMKKIDGNAYWPQWLPWVVQLLSFTIMASFYKQTKSDGSEFALFFYTVPVFLLTPALLLIIGVVSKRDALLALLHAFGGLFYITLPLFLLLIMRQVDAMLPAILIFMIWSNDTLAYLVGSFIGKTPFSSISPKKTWEGTGGGALLTMIAAGVCGYFIHRYHIIDWVMLALCATVAGTLGDLVESKLKRLADVKDSGTLMPGHGGALDRFDSLLLAAPFAAIYAIFFMK